MEAGVRHPGQKILVYRLLAVGSRHLGLSTMTTSNPGTQAGGSWAEAIWLRHPGRSILIDRLLAAVLRTLAVAAR